MSEGEALGQVAVQNPASDILKWAGTRPAWQQDALRRLAISGKLIEADKSELLALIRQSHGLPVEGEPVAIRPLAAEHLGAVGSGSSSDTRILAIREIRHVGRMTSDACLPFGSEGLTAIYGDNGAGKSGYTRILRRAGSGRGDDPKKKILPDVFADPPAANASAVIEVERGGGVVRFAWSADTPDARIPGLAVFDSDASQAYVDVGNAVEWLPFNIDIIQGLIEFCDYVRDVLSREVENISDFSESNLPDVQEDTLAEDFLKSLRADMTAEEVSQKVTLPAASVARLEALTKSIAIPAERVRTLSALVRPVDAAVSALSAAEAVMSDEGMNATRELRFEAERKHKLAVDLNAHLLDGHDLPVDGDTWRNMWDAAKSYAEAVAHPGQDFPNTDPAALCPLCQQPLGEVARDRFSRLGQYVSSRLKIDADTAARASLARMTEIEVLLQEAEDAIARLDLAEENPALAADLAVWPGIARARRQSMDAWLNEQGELSPPPPMVGLRLGNLSAAFSADIARLSASVDTQEAREALDELAELQAWPMLETYKSALLERVRALRIISALEECVSEANSSAVTKFFNEVKFRYLNDVLFNAYRHEVAALRLDRLTLKVTPKSDRSAARFLIDLEGRKNTSCRLSEILSEGERRALSLAAFLAEQSIGGGAGSLVFDDPVSSLDHEWAGIIAQRLATEALRRQVIVFTHDLVFYDKLCRAAEDLEVSLSIERLFRCTDPGSAGHVDPTGSVWNSQKVIDRIAHIRSRLDYARTLASSSPADYHFHAKAIYGRMRDTWERLIEELLFGGVIQRFQKDVSSLKLRYVTANKEIIDRINAGMTRTSTFSHDNPIASAGPIPQPDEMVDDLDELHKVAALLIDHQKAINKNKPSPIGAK